MKNKKTTHEKFYRKLEVLKDFIVIEKEETVYIEYSKGNKGGKKTFMLPKGEKINYFN